MSKSKFCKTHFAGGSAPWMMPCPWPSCPHGHAKDTYCHKILPGHPGTNFRRESFTADDGTPRYFWLADKHPYGWAVRQTVSSELYRLARPIPDVIYHYTSLEGFTGIIESQDFWLTESSFLNDSTEIEHGIDLARDVFKFYSRDIPSPIENILMDLTTPGRELRPKINIGCFSSARDNLSQWRAYSKAAIGISIGFSYLDFLRGLGFPEGCQIVPVLYSDEEKKKLWELFAKFFSEAFAKDLVREISVTHPDGQVKHIYPVSGYDYSLNQMFYQLAASCKHSAFEDEREVRLFYTEHASIVERFANGPAKTRFRSAGSFLAPYTTLTDIRDAFGQKTDEPGPRLAITEVVVGPHPRSDLAIASIKRFMQEKGYGDVPVYPSAAPYR